MRFGVCTTPDRLPQLEAAGYDYLEYNFSSLAAKSDADFEMICHTIDASPLKVETFNGFFPADMLLYDDNAPEKVSAYCACGFARAARLGGRIAVLGSGRARSFPADLAPAVGRDRFIRILRICGDAAAQHGMKIAIEPLRAAECSYINTVAEAADVCRAAAHPAVGCLADFFHVYSSGEPLASIEENRDFLLHIHLARPHADRAFPTVADLEGCRPLADLLHRIGYDARISLEGNAKPDFVTAITAVRPILDLFAGKERSFRHD